MLNILIFLIYINKINAIDLCYKGSNVCSPYSYTSYMSLVVFIILLPFILLALIIFWAYYEYKNKVNLFAKCFKRNINHDQAILQNTYSNNAVELHDQQNLDGNPNINQNNVNHSDESIDHIQKMDISNTQSAPTEEESDIHTESGISCRKRSSVAPEI